MGRPQTGTPEEDATIARLVVWRTALDDFAAGLDTRNGGKLGLHAIAACNEIQVGRIDRAGEDLETDLVVC